MLEFTNKKYDSALSNKFIKIEAKFQKLYTTKYKNGHKLLDLYTQELNKLKTLILTSTKINDYTILSSMNYNKFILEVVINIIKKHITQNNIKPHIIITYNIDIQLINIFKQLVKSNIIELSILYNENLLLELKNTKKNNTLLVLINPINNNIVLDIKAINTYCTYYNILLFSNIYDEIYNYSELNYTFYNQDILLLNYNKYSINNSTNKNKDINIYHILIKNKIILKYDLHEIIQKYNNFKNIDNIIRYIVNLIDVNFKYGDFNLNKLKELYKYIFNKLQEEYRIVNYYDLITNKKINNIKYFTNSITIVTLNLPNIYLLNNIYFSIYSPDINFTNKSLIEYFKLHKIILYPAHKNVLNENLLVNNYEYNNKLKNGLIFFQININTKIADIDKFLLILSSFIKSKILQKNIKSKPEKKIVRFTTPEFIICKKIHNPNTKSIIVKSIIKKK